VTAAPGMPWAGLEPLPPDEPPEVVTGPPLAEPGPAPQAALTVDLFADFMRLELPRRELVASPWLRERDLFMLYGWRGVGKSWVAAGLALVTTSGGRFLRWSVETPRPVVYVDGELPTQALQERFAALAAGSDPLQVPQVPFKIIAADRQERGILSLATCEGQAAVEAHLEAGCLLLLDNVSTLCRTDKPENDAESWLPVQEWLLRLRRQGVTVGVVHHAGKGGQQRGTSRREDVLDSVLVLKRPQDYAEREGARFEVHFEKSRGLAGASVEPFEARLETGDRGAAIWTLRDLDDKLDETILALSRDGMSARAIAREVGRNASTVARRLKAARERGSP